MGKLIVFEGIDGVGKTTLSKGLVAALRERGIPAVRYEDVEDTHVGFNSIKSWVRTECSVESSFFLYLASAIHKSGLITQMLAESWVVCDRYVYSTIAHHLAHGLESRLVPEPLPVLIPDHCFLVTVDEDERMRRALIRENAKEADLVQKSGESFPNRMEQHLMSLVSTQVDNSKADTSDALRQILLRVA